MSTFPVLASSDNVFYIQPIAAGQLQTARAVASALLYRYAGINTGFGAESTAKLQQPLHILQVTLAEWLLVYAHLSDVISMAHTNTLGAPYVGTHKPPQVTLAASGNHVPSFISLLGFLSDWVGAVMPLYTPLMSGNTSAVIKPLLKSIEHIRVTNLAEASPVFRAYVSGKGLSQKDFIHSLNTMFGNNDRQAPPSHVTRIITANGHTPVIVRVRRMARKQSCIPTPVDAALYSEDLEMLVPSTITMLDANTPDAMCGVDVVVCVSKDLRGACFPVFPMELSDAVLQAVPVTAAAETLVNAISVASPAFAELREVTSKALLLGFILPAVQIKQIIREAFADKFPRSTAATAVAAVDPIDDGTGEGGEGSDNDETSDRGGSDDEDAEGSDDDETSDRGSSEDEDGSTPPPLPLCEQMVVGDDAITLYFSRKSFESLQLQFLTVYDFYDSIQLVMDSDERYFIIDTDSSKEEHSGGTTKHAAAKETVKVLAHASLNPSERSTSKKVFTVRGGPSAATTSARIYADELTSVSNTPLTTAVFTREDLLAITLSGETAHDFLRQLWDLHVFGIPGSNFDDDASAHIIDDILLNGLDALQNAGMWQHGVLVEIVFTYENAEEAAQLLEDLYDSLQVLVLQFEDRTLLSYRRGQKTRDLPEKVLACTELTCSSTDPDDNGMVLSPLPRAVSLAITDVDAITEPWLRGVCIAETQLSLFACAQQHYRNRAAVRNALHGILKAANTSNIHSSELAIAMSNDIRVFRRALASL